MSIPRPPPDLFEDKLIGFYPVLEVPVSASPATLNAGIARPLAFVSQPARRPEDPDPEAEFHRTDLNLLFQFQLRAMGGGIALMVVEVEFPDVTLWDEPDPCHPPASLFPFRQIYATPALPLSMPLALQAWRSNFAQVDEDWFPPPIEHNARLFPFRQQQVYQTPTTIRVVAESVGFYNGETRNIGDVFDVRVADFSNVATNFVVGIEGSPFFGWMTIVSPSTPLQANAPTPLTTTNKPRTVF